MSKHKAIPKSKRLNVYKKYNGHCAYCGCELEYKDMQVDHLKSIYLHSDFNNDMDDSELYSLANLMPSCRMCNFYKSEGDVEYLRKRLTETLMPNLQKSFDYRLAIKYGLIQEQITPIKFYFETGSKDCILCGKPIDNNHFFCKNCIKNDMSVKEIEENLKILSTKTN